MKIVVVGLTAAGVLAFRGDMIREMMAAGHSVLAMAPDEDEDARLAFASMGVPYQSTPMQRNGLNPIHDAVTAWRLAKAFRRHGADAVLTFGAKPVVYGLIAARLSGVTLRAAMITGTGTAFTKGEGLRRAVIHLGLRSLYRMSLRHAHVVFFQNPDDERLFRALNLVGSRNRVVQVDGSGVDLEEYSPVPLPPDPVTFVMICRIIGLKGVRDYVEAARAVKRVHPSARFQLIGPLDTNPTAITQPELDTWNREGAIEYLGATRDVRPAIAAAHVAVLPSHGGEGVPRFLLEAMAMSRPIITTDVPGCRETVTDMNGYLVPPRNPQALGDAMLRMVERRAGIEAMARASRSMAIERFDVRGVNRTIMTALALDVPPTTLANDQPHPPHAGQRTDGAHVSGPT